MAAPKKIYFDTALGDFLDYKLPFRGEFRDLTRYADGLYVNIPVRDESQRPGTRLVGTGTYPMQPVQRNHETVQFPMEITNTIPEAIPDPEKWQTSYDKVVEHLKDHFNELANDSAEEIAYSVAPPTDTTSTPILRTTGPAKINGEKALIQDDIIRLAEAWNSLKLPHEGRNLVLTNSHLMDLARDDKDQYHRILDFKKNPAAKPFSYLGFNIAMYSDAVYYDVSSGVQLVRGALPGAGDLAASFAWVKDEVGHVETPDKVVMNPQDPLWLGCVFSVWKAYKTKSLRLNGEGTASIRYSN